MEKKNIRVEIIRHESFKDTRVAYVYDAKTEETFGQITMPFGVYTTSEEESELIEECREQVVSQHHNRNLNTLDAIGQVDAIRRIIRSDISQSSMLAAVVQIVEGVFCKDGVA
jgi:hypothetical protein